MFGLEIRDRSVIALAADDAGAVVTRAETAFGDGVEAASAALASFETLDGPHAGTIPRAIGVAAAHPDAVSTADVLRTIGARRPGTVLPDGAMPSGSAAAVAEAWVGAGRGVRDVVYFSADDHMTAGIVRDGSPWLGARRRAAAIGWLSLNPVEREDYRRSGCLEAEAASGGIVRRLVWRIKAGDRSRVADQKNGDLTAITVDDVLTAAREGDGVSISVMRDTAKYLGMAAANLVVLADPELLVLGGILASAADVLLEPVRTEIGRRLPKAMFDDLRIETGRLGRDAAAIGAARSAAMAQP